MATKPDGLDWTEPSSTFVGEYPYAHVTETQSGHLFAMDDTKDSETIRLAHRLGTFTEFQKDGTRVDKIVGDGYQIIAKNNYVLIKGVCNIKIEGDSALHVQGDADIRIDGDAVTQVKGDLSTTVKGAASIFAQGDLDLGTSGTATINAKDGINLNGDVTVNGLLTAASSIHAGDNIVAEKQLFSYLGIQTLGGINSGFTSESPVPPGVFTSTVKVTAPIIFGFAAVQDSRGTMELIRQLYNGHIHGTPHGVSTTPTPIQ